jgi:hypothetical protein
VLCVRIVETNGLGRAAAGRVDQPAAVVALLTCEADLALDADLLDGLPGVVAGQAALASPGGFGTGQTDVRDAWQLNPERLPRWRE